ncbi:MAG: large-conductance mechanosensitive channel protein MscL [Gemmatimonadota bacterium]|nr:large-conductance mechanosensitive channel protein MscL [Gemmatimonadota bacterium]
MLKDFKEFAMRGNVVDMAVGIIIGGAFGTIVKSLVSDVIMPPIGLLMGGVSFSELSLVLQEATADAEAVTINYGVFIDNVIAFLIIAFAVFLLVRAMVSMQKKDEAAPPPPDKKDCPFCFSTVAIKATRCANCTSELKAA